MPGNLRSCLTQDWNVANNAYSRTTARTIAARDIAELQARLQDKKRSAKTVRNILGVLSSALTVAKGWGYLETLPICDGRCLSRRFPSLP